MFAFVLNNKTGFDPKKKTIVFNDKKFKVVDIKKINDNIVRYLNRKNNFPVFFSISKNVQKTRKNNFQVFCFYYQKFVFFKICPCSLKISVLKVDTRNEILSFFYFLFCRQNSKKTFLISLGGDIRRSIKYPKTNSEGIRRNCGQKVYFGSIRWIRPKLG
jgi:hypothetical protein